MHNSYDNQPVYDAVQCTLNKYHPCPTLLLDPGHCFFIKRIEFYKNMEDAENARDGTVIDLSSRKAAERTLRLDTDNADGLFGKYEFDAAERALSLKRSESSGKWADYGSRVKFSIRMKTASVLGDDSSYMVVTYKTNISGKPDKIRLLLENYWGNYIILDPDVSVSCGRYVRSKPINIRQFDLPKQDFFERLRHPRYLNSDYTDADLIYIAPSDESGTQTHRHIEMLYIADGVANVHIHSTHYMMQRGDMVIVPPMCAHNVASKATGSTLYSIMLMPEQLYIHDMPLSTMRYYLAIWQRHLRHNPFIGAEELHEYGLDKLIVELINLLQSHTFAHQIKIHAKLMSIFAILLDRCSSEETDSDRPATLITQFEAAIDEAKKSLHSFTTADAAKACNLSYNYFCAGFKKAYGMAFSAYLDSMRLHESERLLLTTEMSVTDIAMSIGFSDTSHYIKKFKLAYNLTPRQFRDRMRNAAEEFV
ncbi:MAG: AraC family transcriptional regulator [Clostridia bacterium]|nr:AraC family transcriptional regulator [Clostridia bacterium]